MAAVAERLGPAPPDLPADWPHRECSRSVTAGGLRWHVQVMGRPASRAPTALLLHGTGASSHSWRGLAKLLARKYHVIVPDLPGHGWTGRPLPVGLTLPGMAAALGSLLRKLGAEPALIIGHSAGAAIAARMCLDGLVAPRALVSLNGAWFPPGGVSGWHFSPLAKMLTLNPVVPYLFSWQASRPAALRRLISSTGSKLDDEGIALYGRLVGNPSHVGAVLAMMAAWDLQPLLNDLSRLKPALHLVVGECDGTVPPQNAVDLQRRLPAATVHRLPSLGHLAHEESPGAVAALIEGLNLTQG
jgi:magnesium chelatase accessory protein